MTVDPSKLASSLASGGGIQEVPTPPIPNYSVEAKLTVPIQPDIQRTPGEGAIEHYTKSSRFDF